MTDETPGPLEASPEAWLDWTSRRQQLASDPDRSAWVSANAGSGKTHVLTQRVIRLLLAGCRPSAILCLTYTKAAASEMSNRVFERLAVWATLDDDALATRLAEMEGRAPSAIKLAMARKLFARALETPGGLKIQTIHAFCEALLHQFPLEANVAGHFSVLDDRASATLLADARRALLTATASEDDPDLAGAFATVLDLADDTGLEGLLAAIVARRSAIRLFLAEAKTLGGTSAALRRALALGPDDTLDSAYAAFWPLPGLGGAMLTNYIEVAHAAGGSNAVKVADALVAASRMERADDRAALLRSTFFKDKDVAYADAQFLTKPMIKQAPHLVDAIAQAVNHLSTCIDHMKRVSLFNATEAALTLAARLISDYEDIKKSRGLLDFDDLIERTEALLSISDASAWVHYKLDRGIDHILVDEAQDTSPSQWTIIRSLATDFFSGDTARTDNRTIFAVGDEKQSIYSFQGARPERFAIEGTRTARAVEDGAKLFSPVRLQLSFRSTQDILSAVDAVFARPAHARGLSALGDPVVHASNRVGHPGQVDIWDVVPPEESIPEDDWTAAFDSTPENAPANILAQRIASTLSDWIGRETIIDAGKRRAIRPGDIIILVRKRDAFINCVLRALKQKNRIPVAGADRLVLTRHIAVQDLMALGSFVLMPQDDLSLAAVLKSPLFDLSEDDIFALCLRDAGISAWERLRNLAEAEVSPFKPAAVRLAQYIEIGRSLPVYDFYARVLAADGGRAAFLGRLGNEASDILDEFMTFALDTEKTGMLGLQGFISTLELESPTLKREQDKQRDEVRVMTVHAAKGLEAPVVFLVDGGSAPFQAQQVSGLRLVRSTSNGMRAAVPLWQAPGQPASRPIADDNEALRVLAEEEYRRLLYVGMTRAADRLIVCGYRGKRDVPETWHAMVSASLSSDAVHCSAQTFRSNGLEWSGFAWRSAGLIRPLDEQANGANDPDGPALPLPRDLGLPLPPQRHLPRPLSPSGVGIAIDAGDTAGDAASPVFDPARPANRSLQRGAILHRFLQVLPGLPVSDRAQAAGRYLDRAVPYWSNEERQGLVRSVLNLLDMPEMVDLFGPGSRAEVSVMGQLTLGSQVFAVSGRIDRIAVTGTTVTLADFKTNRTVPETIGDVSFAHKAQLAIYRDLMQPLYPDKEIQCLLVYTEGPVAIALPASALDACLEALAANSALRP